ncbi:MAG: cold shock domain-containing protein [Pseudomonadota bacterium]
MKFWEDQKGYGFIARDVGEDVFVHYSAIVDGSRSLTRGLRVEFCVTRDSGSNAATLVVGL